MKFVSEKYGLPHCERWPTISESSIEGVIMIPVRMTQGLDSSITGFFQDNSSLNAKPEEIQQITSSGHLTLASMIGFSAPELRGTLIVIAPSEVVRNTHPMTAFGETVAESDLVDWLGEISNQVLGRWKNSLLGTGITLSMAVPTSVTATDLKIPGQERLSKILRSVKLSNGSSLQIGVFLSFDESFDPAVIDAVQVTGGDAPPEGVSILF